MQEKTLQKIKVFIVDDSAVVRQILSRVLSTDPELEIVGRASNGRIALEKIPSVQPDLITLDLEMPEMNGMETIKAVKAHYPHIAIVVVSSLSERGATITMDALLSGASDYITKPNNVNNLEESLSLIKQELIPKIKHLYFSKKKQTPSISPEHKPSLSDSRLSVPPKNFTSKVEIVAIGVSTGGPMALGTLFSQFPENFPVPIVIVQHMPPIFTRFLADRLNQKSKIKVFEAQSGDILRPGSAWLAPGDFHMTVIPKNETVQILLDQNPPQNFCRPSVDVLFSSVAQVFAAKVLAIVLTGMGQDGFKGCQQIHKQGGHIVLQDEKSSVVWGMPGTIARAGLAEKILPIEELASEIVRRV